MTSVEFINYFAPRPTLVLTFVVLFCFALFFAYLIAFKNATKGKNYIITFFCFHHYHFDWCRTTQITR